MRVTTGISIEAEILREAKIRASKMRRTLSNYVEGLIIEDIEKHPVINSDHQDNTKGGLKKRKGAPQHNTKGGLKKRKGAPQHNTKGGLKKRKGAPQHNTKGGLKKRKGAPQHNTKGGLKKRKGAPQLHKVKSFNELKEVIRVRRDYYPTNYMDCLLLDNKKDTLSKIVEKFRQYAESIKYNDLLTVPRLKAHIKYRIFHDGWIFKTSGDSRDPIVTLVGLKKE